MAIGRKGKLILVLVAFLGVIAAWQGIRYWWYHGYSNGERTGIIRKLSVKGNPICKYLEGELALSGGSVGQPVETWQFSIDDHSDANPVMKQLHDAERDGTRITLHYRQDLKSWYRCTPHEYFITTVETVAAPKP